MAGRWNRGPFDKGHLYFIGADIGPIKIGHSCNPAARLRGLQTSSPHKLRLLAVLEDGGHEEADYHQLFAKHRLHGEWFKPHRSILTEIAEVNRNQGNGFAPRPDDPAEIERLSSASTEGHHHG